MVSADTLRALLPLLLVAGLITFLQVLLLGTWWYLRNYSARSRSAPDGTHDEAPRPGGDPLNASIALRAGDSPQTLTRDEAVEALRCAEAKYRSIFENAIEGIFQTTPDGRYLSANPALARIYDYDSPYHLIAAIGDIERQLYVDPHRRDDFVRVMEEQGFVANFEAQIYRRDRSVIWISESARAVRAADDSIQFYEGTVEDITERKQSEALFREKEAAEAASRAKSQFLANMSHELRTPLNGVIGMLDLLLESPTSPQQKRFATIARSSADLLLSVINQILDFSKIEAGKLELDQTDFQLRSVVEETLDMLASKAAQKGLELALDMPPELSCTFRGDPHRLQQIVVNLLGNAIKFTERGQVHVHVSVLSEDEKQVVVRVAVEDTGIGIATERLDRLFRSFSQVDASTTRQFGGTGLGLAISKQLVELMDGQIGVKSALDRGSSFWFAVPLAKSVDAEAARPLTPRALHGLRVLVVDDNATNREILFRQLSAWQIRVDTASDGATALEMLHRAAATGDTIDLGIIDYHMPGMDGCELARRVASDERTRQIPLVLLTSLTTPSQDEDDADMPIAGRLTKPVRQSQLLDTILHVAARYGRGRDSALAPSLGVNLSSSVRAGRGKPNTDSAARRSRCRLLLAEDNEVNRIVAIEILTLAGFHCEVATNGREAIERVLAESYDAVLMDCQMPEIDGLAATREIRRLETHGVLRERGYRLPIIALTANATCGDRELCLGAGMDEYLTKPLDAAKLTDMLDIMVGTLAGVFLFEGDASPRETGCSEDEIAESALDPAASDAEPMHDAPLDVVALTRRCLGNQELVGRLVVQFAERLPAIATAIEDAVNRNQLREAAAQAHSLKGSAANLSALRLQQVAGDLETTCGARDHLLAVSDVARIRREVDRCLDFIVRSAASAEVLTNASR
jgi:PAS domain S-box-containing protein